MGGPGASPGPVAARAAASRSRSTSRRRRPRTVAVVTRTRCPAARTCSRSQEGSRRSRSRSQPAVEDAQVTCRALGVVAARAGTVVGRGRVRARSGRPVPGRPGHGCREAARKGGGPARTCSPAPARRSRARHSRRHGPRPSPSDRQRRRRRGPQPGSRPRQSPRTPPPAAPSPPRPVSRCTGPRSAGDAVAAGAPVADAARQERVASCGRRYSPAWTAAHARRSSSRLTGGRPAVRSSARVLVGIVARWSERTLMRCPR